MRINMSNVRPMGIAAKVPQVRYFVHTPRGESVVVFSWSCELEL